MRYNLKWLAALSVFLVSSPVEAVVTNNSSVTNNPSVAKSVVSEFVKISQVQGKKQRRDEALRLNQPLQLAQSAELQEAEKLNQQAFHLYKQGKYTEAIPLAEKALANQEKVLGGEHADVAASLNNLAEFYRLQGNYTKAEPLHLRALAIREKVLGGEHPDLATSLNHLAILYYSQGNYDKAEPLFKRALAIREKILGKKHPDVATSLNNVAELYKSQGSYTKAEPLLLRALAINEKVLGGEHPHVASSLNNVAVLYYLQGNYDKAEPFYTRALAINEKVLGKEHPDVANSLNLLAQLYVLQGNYDKAEPMLVRALAINEKVLGKEHPHVATSLNLLAQLYYSQGNYDKAEPLYIRSLAIRKKVLGEEHPDVATSLNLLAQLYYSQGNYDKAEPLYIRALAIRKKVLGEEHPYVASSLGHLAVLYLKQGNYGKAKPLFVRALAIKEKALGGEHPDVATILGKLAVLYQKQGNYAKAESLFVRSLAIKEKTLGGEHLEVAASLNNLATLYRSQRNYGKAESLFVRSLAICEKVLGREHPFVAQSLNNLADLYRAQWNYDKAEPLYLRSLAIREKVLGKEHPDVAESLNNLAILYRSQGNFGKAEPLYLRSLAIREKVLHGEHPDVATSLNSLAFFYQLQENYGKAEPLYRRTLAIYKKVLGEEHRTVANNLNNLAWIYWGKGDITRTTDFLTRGLAVQEKNLHLIYAVGSEQRKQKYAQAFTGTTDAVVTLALQQSSKNPTLAKLALTTVLRRKGRVLDAMTDTVQILRSQLADNPETKKLFDDWLDVQRRLANLIYQGQGKQKFEIYRQQIKELQAEKEKLEEQVSVRSAEFRKEIQPVELADIQAKIPADAAMVEIVQYQPFNPKAKKDSEAYGKPHYAAVVLRNTGEPSWVDLGDAATIDKSVANFRRVLAFAPATSTNSKEDRGGIYDEPIEGKRKKQLEELARNLDKQVMAPIRPLLGSARHLLLSPDGQLNLIPFEALKDEQNKYLVEKYAFSYLTTGRDLLRLETTAKKSNPVVFADINYEQQETFIASKSRGSENKRSTDFANLKYNPLAATLAEGQQIKKIFPDTNIITGTKATEEAIKKLKTPSILHLATHGFFLPDKEIKPVSPAINKLNNQLNQPSYVNLENPLLRSGLALAGFNNRQNKQTNNSTEDGVLTALEVAGLNLRGTELVVLSACETGVGDVKTGDGVYGLRRALLIAGSQTQLLSLWKVADNETKDLMVEYYQKIKAGKGRHEALREVQLEFLKSSKYNHPYFWASFIPSGNWKKMN